MKNVRDVAIIAFVVLIWINTQFCHPGTQTGGNDTLSHTIDTFFMPGHDTVIIKEFHYSSQVTTQVPALTPEQKDCTIQDYYTIRSFDTTFLEALNYRQHLRISIEQNKIKELFSDFENLRPTVVYNTTTVNDTKKVRFLIGAQLQVSSSQTSTSIIAGLQSKKLDLLQLGYSPESKSIIIGGLWHPRIK